MVKAWVNVDDVVIKALIREQEAVLMSCSDEFTRISGVGCFVNEHKETIVKIIKCAMQSRIQLLKKCNEIDPGDRVCIDVEVENDKCQVKDYEKVNKMDKIQLHAMRCAWCEADGREAVIGYSVVEGSHGICLEHQESVFNKYIREHKSKNEECKK